MLGTLGKATAALIVVVAIDYIISAFGDMYGGSSAAPEGPETPLGTPDDKAVRQRRAGSLGAVYQPNADNEPAYYRCRR